MGKFFFSVLFLCLVITGTVWIEKYRVRELSLANNDSLAAQLIDEVSEVGEAFFLRQPPAPDPEEVSRFKKAVEREIERLNAIRREARPRSFTTSKPGAMPSYSILVPESAGIADDGQIR